MNHFEIPDGVRTPIYPIGDSHIKVLLDAAPNIFKSSKTDIVVAVHESKSAYAVGSEGHDFYLNENLQKIPDGEVVILSFGEIDCRHYVPKMAIKNNSSIKTEVDNVIDRYTKNCVRVLKEKFRVIILGAYSCPQDRTNENSYNDIFEAKKIFNDKIEVYCNREGILFIPIFKVVLDRGWDKEAVGDVHIWADDSHLGDCMIPIILHSMIDVKWKNFDYQQ